MSVRQVALADWLSEVSAVSGEGLAALTVVDRAGRPELWLRTVAGTVLWCEVAGAVPSVAGLFVEAGLVERELSQLFGVEFDRPESNQPLFVGDADWLGRRPLSSPVGLARRNHIPWPGAKEPGESGSPSRRRQLPAGVAPGWQDGSEVTL